MNIRNPRTGKCDYEIVNLSVDQVQKSCASLRKEQQHWAKSEVTKRIEVLQQWKNTIEKYKPALKETLCIDTGRKSETLLEVDLVASSIDRWCIIAKELFQPVARKNTTIPFIHLQQEWIAFKLVGVISPWNFPLLLSLIDSIPALLAGCAVIIKPSEVTPRFIKVIQQTIQEVPQLAKVFAYIEGNSAVGSAIVNNCDLICFTGSSATGKKVYEAASKRMIPIFLELGGKDPAIIMEGANIELATSSVLWGSTVNAGQSCLSIERVYVQENIYDAFIQLIIAKAAALRLNAGDIDEGQIGPIIFEKQAHIINAHLKDAIEKGAIIKYGDKQCQEINGGFYCLPTILTNVNHQMKLMTEETFGPLIPIMKFKTKEEAITLANECIYGLGAAVFAKTDEEAIQIGSRIETGAISINDSALTAVMHEGEKNSFKLSGIGGSRMGPSAIKRFMRQKVYIIKTENINSPWWYKA